MTSISITHGNQKRVFVISDVAAEAYANFFAIEKQPGENWAEQFEHMIRNTAKQLMDREETAPACMKPHFEAIRAAQKAAKETMEGALK